MTYSKQNGFKTVYSNLQSLIINLLIVYVAFVLCRIVFVLANISYFPGLTFAKIWKMYCGSIQFDISAILYTNILYILMMSIPFHFRDKKKWYRSTAKWVFIITNSLAIIMNLMDTVYFSYTNKRTTASVLQQFGNEDNIFGIIGIEIVRHWYITLFAIVLIYCMYKLYHTHNVTKIGRKIVYYLSQTVILVSVGIMWLVGVRGGLGADVHPITISNANEYVSRPIESSIVLNTPFSIYRTLGKRVFVNPKYFSDENTMVKLYSPVHEPIDSVAPKHMNVVILIMESFGKEYVGALNGITDVHQGGKKSYTPFLDSLITKSLTYEYSFANGRGSIDGLPSVLSGIPKFLESFFLTPASLNEISSVGGELKKKGYYTAFFHGAQNSSMGFHAYSHTVGYTDYFGRSDYNNDADFDGRWAIWDEEFLQFFANKMSTFKQPFATGIFTATSHHPFNIPARYENVYKGGPLQIHRCVEYSDNALRRFFDTAKKQEWYNNTIFIITADHTNQSEYQQYQTESGLFAVPIIFFTPNGDLHGYNKESIAQQIDIMPTVLNYLGYDKPYISFGRDLLNTPSAETDAVNYVNDVYQYYKGNYLLQFDGEKVVGLYNYRTDNLLQHNLKGTLPNVQDSMEQTLKAIIQQYMQRMIEDKLVIK